MFEPSVDPSVNIAEVFSSWLTAKSGFEEAALEEGFGGRLKMGGGRGLFWRYYLGIVTAPTGDTETDESEDADPVYDHFVPQLEASRKYFADWEASRKNAAATPAGAPPTTTATAKKRKGPRFGDESDSDSDDDEAAAPAAGGDKADNPLSASESSAWTKYFEKQKKMDLVDRDLARLWSGVEFFENPNTRAQLREILECMLDTEVVTDYCQGMHELVSIVFLVLSLDAEAVSSIAKTAPNYEFLRVACSVRYLKHDTFAIFRQILTSKKNGLGLSRWYEADPDHPDDSRLVVKQSEAIQGPMLAAADPPVSTHLSTTLDVQPAAYGLRWLRLLFLREFPTTQVACVWDAIFANHAATDRSRPPGQSLAPHIAVAMLVFIRNDLLQDDYALVLRRLMRFPPVEAVSVLIQRAAILAHGPGSKIAGLCGSAKSLLDARSADSEEEDTDPNPSFVVVPNPTSNPRGGSPPSLFDTAPVTTAISSAPSAVPRGPTRREQDVGTALAAVIDKMNARWFPDPNAPAATDDTDYILAIAELKRLRDVLLNGLPL